MSASMRFFKSWVYSSSVTIARKSLRTLRMATLASSDIFFACLASSFRRSSVRAGNCNRTRSASAIGLMPNSALLIASRIALISFLSYGLINNCLGSGTAILAIWLIGVGSP